MNLFDAYLTTAKWIAALHLGFFVTCIILWAVEYFRLGRESKTYVNLWPKAFKDLEESERQKELEKSVVHVAEGKAEVSKIAGTMLLMVKKGELPSPESIRARLIRSLARHDPIVRACLNGFIISGLIGTLYNLWELGPNFWAGLIQGQSGVGYPSIGIAFSASVFGLVYALAMTFLEIIFVRRGREGFARDASAGLYDAAVILLPPTDSAAVAEALNKFHDTSTGFLSEFKSRHEEIARQFTQQVQSSSASLIGTLNDIGAKWEGLTNCATAQITGAGNSLEAEVRGLTEVTATAHQSIGSAVSGLQQVTSVLPALTELRAKVETLLAEITARLSGFDEQWREDLRRLSREHAENLGETSGAWLELYKTEAAEWHQKSAEALQGFSSSIENSISQWGEERQQVGTLVDDLVEGWRRELGQIMTGMQAGLAQLREQVGGLEAASTQLANASNSNVQQLNTLQNAVANISRNIVEGTPIGAAISDVTRAVEELRVFLRGYTAPVVTVDGRGVPPGMDLGEIHSLLNQILSKLQPPAFRAAPAGSRPVVDDGSDVIATSRSDSAGHSVDTSGNDRPRRWYWPFRK